MAKISSKDSVVQVEISGVPTSLVAVSDWSLNLNRNTIDVSTISTEFKEFLTGQIQADGSCNLIYDTDIGEAESAIKSAMMAGDQVTFHILPEGIGAGLPDLQLPAFITSWNNTAGTEDAIRIAVSFTGTGPLVDGTQPTT